MKMIPRRALLRSAAIWGLGWAFAGCVPRQTSAPGALNVNPTSTIEPTKPAILTAQPSPSREPTPTPASRTPTKQAPTLSETASHPTPSPAQIAYLAAVRGANPEATTMRALAAIGGIERFVKKGYDVIIKPNICNANHGPEYASTTNPEVVATLVKLALGAGAKRVRVMDYPFAGSAQAAYARSGIEEAVKAAGGEMEVMATMRFIETDIPEGRDLHAWPIYQPILEADLIINVPIAKHHSLARLTLAGKNLMGVIQNRSAMHRNLGQRIADITSAVRPQLTVVDAVRILVAHGPTGGSLDDVVQANTVIASHDLVAADAYATSLFGLTPADIAYITASAAMGLGTMDLSTVHVEEINL